MLITQDRQTIQIITSYEGAIWRCFIDNNHIPHCIYSMCSVWSWVLKDNICAQQQTRRKSKQQDCISSPSYSTLDRLSPTWQTKSVIIWTIWLIIAVCLLLATGWAALWVLLGILSFMAIPTTSVYVQIQPVFLWVVNYQLPPIIYGNLLPHYCRPPEGQ